MDSRIALGINPLVIPDQSASLQKALTLNALMGQSDLQGIQLQEAQRTMRRNTMLDEAASGSGSTNDYLERLRRIDPASAIKLQNSLLDTQKTQGQVSELERANGAAMASAIINASPQDRPAVYSQLRQQEVAKGNKHAIASPEQWSDALLPHIIAAQQQGLAPKDALERQDFSNTGQPAVPGTSPTVAALAGQPRQQAMPTQPQDATNPTLAALGGRPIDTTRPILNNRDGSFSTERTITIEVDGKHFVIPTIVGGQILTPDQAVAAWRDGKNNEVGVYASAQEAEAAAQARSKQIGQVRGAETGATDPSSVATVRALQGPPMDVTAKAPVETPEGLRAEAARLETLPRSKVTLDQAKEKRAQAVALEGKILEQQKIEMDKWTPVPSAPGVSFNKVKNAYMMDGQPISAKDVQAIANSQQLAGASRIDLHTEKSLYGQIADTVGANIAAQSASAKDAVKTIRSADQIRTALDSGRVMSGPGAGIRLTGAQIAETLGFGSDTAGLTQTRAAIQGLAKLGLSARGSLKGSGAISDFEQRTLMKAESGDIEKLTGPELRAIADVADRAARFEIQRNATNVGKLKNNKNAGDLADFMAVDEPPAYVKAGSNKTAPQAGQPMTATNPSNGQRIISNDGGKTWQPAK